MEQLTDGFQPNAFDFLKQFLSLASNGKSAIGIDKGNLVIGYSNSTKNFSPEGTHCREGYRIPLRDRPLPKLEPLFPHGEKK